MQCKETVFGKLADGREVCLFHFTCEGGMKVGITNFGGIITSLEVPDRNGKLSEVTAGFPNLEEYLKPHPYFGALIGRYAGRIGNGHLTVQDEVYQLNKHDTYCHLHGGETGFHTRLWNADLKISEHFGTLTLKYLSPHLEENYPGNLDVAAVYTIFDDNRIQLEFTAVTDRPTHLNLTNHAYFNLNGFESGVSDHMIRVSADSSVELGDTMLPTGRIVSIKGGIMDFGHLTKLTSRNIPASFELDHCFVLDHLNSEVADVEVVHADSGRRLQIFTSQPGVQIYSGNFLDGSLTGNNGTVYHKHSAICFETQHFADSPNQPDFPSTLLLPENVFKAITTYKFDTV
ncbi:MAG TPA: aldose epimerase family protein [Bacteroidales bacterium]|nr:aldose epimerase family protein [Bacteroidales bacterium]